MQVSESEWEGLVQLRKEMIDAEKNWRKVTHDLALTAQDNYLAIHQHEHAKANLLRAVVNLIDTRAGLCVPDAERFAYVIEHICPKRSYDWDVPGNYLAQPNGDGVSFTRDATKAMVFPDLRSAHRFYEMTPAAAEFEVRFVPFSAVAKAPTPTR